MEQQITSIAFLISGLIVGTSATWLIFRNRIAIAVTNATNNQQLENVRLNERFSALQDENNRHQVALDECDVEIDNLRNQLNKMENEHSTLAERASHQTESINQLEQDKENLAIQNSDLSKQIQYATAKIAEVTTQLEAEQTQGKKKLNCSTMQKNN